MRFFVFQLFLVSLLLSVTGCQQENPEITNQQENPEITKLWEENEKIRQELIELTKDPDIGPGSADFDRLLKEQRSVLLAILEIDPDATYQNSEIGIAENIRSLDAFVEAKQRAIEKLQNGDASGFRDFNAADDLLNR